MSRGYIALITILIVSAVTLTVAISANLFGISEMNMGLDKIESQKAFYLANLCAEEAQVSLKNDLGYLGGETLSFGEGHCNIFPLEGSGNEDRIIKTGGVFRDKVRRIRIEIKEVNPEMKIRNWQEVVNL